MRRAEFIELNYIFEPMDDRKPLSGPCLIRVDDITCILPSFHGCRVCVEGVTIEITDDLEVVKKRIR